MLRIVSRHCETLHQVSRPPGRGDTRLRRRGRPGWPVSTGSFRRPAAACRRFRLRPAQVAVTAEGGARQCGPALLLGFRRVPLAGCVSGVYISRRLCFWCVSLSPAVFLVCISLAGCVSGVCISRRLCFRNGVSLSPVFFSVCLPRRFSFRCVSLAGFLFGVSLSPVFFSVSPSPAVFPACLSRTLRSSGPARAFDGRGDRHTLSPARTKQGAARPSGAGCTGVSGRAGRPTSRSRPRSREIAARSRRDHVLAAGHRRPSCLATRRGARRTRTGAQMTRRGAQMSRRGAQMTRREGEAAISAPTRPKTLLPGLHRALDACAPFRPLARPPPLLRSLHVSPQLLLY